jgi:Zn finger protein HypA/HybF involved in hydrogenase expression
MENEATKQARSASNLEFKPESLQPPSSNQKSSRRLRAGDLCPNCHSERLDYDGLLNLACPKCGYALSGCFT